MGTLHALLGRYVLLHDLRQTSEAYYERVVSVFCSWYGDDIPTPQFVPEVVSRFLKAKQEAGLAPHYLKSLRSGLRSLLNFAGKPEPIRSVRLTALPNDTWTAEEVMRLIAAVAEAIETRHEYWRTLIEAAYYSGLSHGDLVRLDRSHLRPGGVVVINRSRTGKRVVTWLPPHLVAFVETSNGPPWQLPHSAELFRRQFKRIVETAGLSGTFKRLRKSSGTAVEALNPGRGHEHLANTRGVFVTHYLNQQALPLVPLHPPMLPNLDARPPCGPT